MLSDKFQVTNECATRTYFDSHAKDLGVVIVTSHTHFPDYQIMFEPDGFAYKDAFRFFGANQLIDTEAEYESRSFISHMQDPAWKNKCSLVICWFHNRALPIPVWELKTNSWWGPEESVVVGRRHRVLTEAAIARKIARLRFETQHDKLLEFCNQIGLPTQEAKLPKETEEYQRWMRRTKTRFSRARNYTS